MRQREKLSHALSRARGVIIEDDLREYRDVVRAVRAFDTSGLAGGRLARRAAVAGAAIRAGSDPGAWLVPVFAMASEAARRALGQDPFDEQLAAAVALHRGRLVQVQTGEGKTLAAVFPACLAGMAGRGVHVLTANDYLAARDARWMGPVYRMLGLRAAAIGGSTHPAQRREAYAADVTYLTAREAGFDYLRDGLRTDSAAMVQRGLAAAIVDEADFLLIDEARVPLVIAGEAESDGVDVVAVDRLVRSLREGEHVEMDREGRRVSLTLEGQRRVEQELAMGGIHEEQGARAFARVHAALHAHHLLRRDVDYVVRGGLAELVDGFTGRVADRRVWPWGIQAALEAKEGLARRPEGRAYGAITVQHLAGLYGSLAAMTATAVAAAEEMSGTYGLATVVIPTVQPMRRIDLPDLVFATRAAKTAAVVTETRARHATGQPVLVCTASVAESQELAELLAAGGVPCSVLNAKNDEREAEVIAEAGRLGAVTISTSMAGRGTDIRLAGPDGGRRNPGEHERLCALGGLAVLGTTRHESRRVDDQLRGRAGRQGEPGVTRFFVSLEDPLFERYGVREFIPRGLLHDGQADGRQAGGGAPIEDPRVSREIARAQSILEAQNHAIRRTLRKYSGLVEMDRRVVRALRDDALTGRLPGPVEEACAGLEGDLRARAVQAYLAALDDSWADHLALVEEVREGIHLERLASRDPGLEYIRRVGDAFLARLADVEERTADACRRAAGDPSLLSAAAMGIPRPSSTWTYQVDDESPVGPRLSAVGSAHVAAAIASGVVQGIATLARLPPRLLGRLAGLLSGREGGRRGGGRRGGAG
jgi:preprotein translocase subunit SecA